MITQMETLDIMNYIFAEHEIAISENRLKVWHDQLKHLDLAIAMQVAKILVGKKSFGVPKISDFMEALQEFHDVGKLSLEEAWSKTFSTVLRFGRYSKLACLEHVQRTYPELYDSTNILFEEICSSAPSDIPVIRSQFWKMMQSKTEKTQKQRRILPLIDNKRPDLTQGEQKALSLVNDMGSARKIE